MSIFGDALSAFTTGVSDFGSSIFDSVGSTAGEAGDALSHLGDSDFLGNFLKFAGDTALEGVNYYATTEAADQAMKAGESAAKVFDSNADLLFDEADKVDTRTFNAIVQARYQAIQLQSQQIMAYSKSGVTLEGTPLIVHQDTANQLETSMLDLQEKGQSAASQLRAQAGIEQQKGSNALDQGAFTAKATLTKGAVDTAKRVFDF